MSIYEPTERESIALSSLGLLLLDTGMPPEYALQVVTAFMANLAFGIEMPPHLFHANVVRQVINNTKLTRGETLAVMSYIMRKIAVPMVLAEREAAPPVAPTGPNRPD